jgi:hypothetical protein
MLEVQHCLAFFKLSADYNVQLLGQKLSVKKRSLETGNDRKG